MRIGVMLCVSTLWLWGGVFDFLTIEKGISAYKKGDWIHAKEAFLELSQTKQTPQCYYNLGNCYYKLGEWNKAIVYYKKALVVQDKPFLAKIYYNLANSYAQNGDYSRAIMYYETSLENGYLVNAESNLVIVKEKALKEGRLKKRRGKE